MFWDLYTEDGKVRRYVATDMQGKRVRFVCAWLPTSVPHDLSKRSIRRWGRNVPGNGGSVGGGPRTPRSGLVASIRHEDGRLDVYDYSLVSNLWVVTHLHEQSPAPVSGKTTRDVTITNARGEEIEARTEAYIDGMWYTISRNRMTYNAEGKRIRSENLAGQVTTTAWDSCHKVSETGPDGSATTWDYDAEGRMIASSRLIPLDTTNVTWLTTCYEHDDLGRKTYEGGATYPVRYTYDIFGNKTTMTTYRDETSRTGGSPVQGDATTWLYDIASGSLWDLGKDGMTLTMSAWKGVCHDRL